MIVLGIGIEEKKILQAIFLVVIIIVLMKILGIVGYGRFIDLNMIFSIK